MLSFLSMCICPIRVYVKDRLVYEGCAADFHRMIIPREWELDYISSSIHTDFGDTSEAELNVNMKSFIDIYFTDDI